MSGRGPLGLVIALLALGLAVRIASAELVQQGTLRLDISAELRPKRLPRSGQSPVEVSIASRLSTTDHSVPPSLRKMRIELNRHGRLDTAGLPECRIDQIQPASTAAALSACRPALVGRGSFSVDVVLGGQDPYPIAARLLLFNAHYKGHPAILGQIYSARPFANSFVIPFQIGQLKHGSYGVVLTATLPAAFTSWGHITALQLHLARRYRYRGARHSFISAGCPAPDGISSVAFPLARASFSFAGAETLSRTLNSSCRARGEQR